MTLSISNFRITTLDADVCYSFYPFLLQTLDLGNATVIVISALGPSSQIDSIAVTASLSGKKTKYPLPYFRLRPAFTVTFSKENLILLA